MVFAITLKIEVKKWKNDHEGWPTERRTEFGLLSSRQHLDSSELAMLKARLEADWMRSSNVEVVEITEVRSVKIDFDFRGLFPL